MQSRLAGGLAVLVLLSACGMRAAKSGSGGGEATPGAYVNQAAKFSFQVPPGWKEKKSLNPFRKAGYLVRYESPTGDAAAVASSGPLGSQTCIEAGVALLETSNGTALKSEETFYVKTSAAELPAGQGMISFGNRRGAAKVFCDGDRIVVLEASADKAAYGERKNELSAILESFMYRESKGDVPVVAAKVPPPPSYFIHTVKFRGQTLGKIAEWYTGNYENWKEFSAVNELSAPNVKLKVGREVKIPKTLVVQENPMPEPKHKVSSRKPKAPGKAASAKAGAGGEEDDEEEEEGLALPPVMGPR